MSYVIRCYEGQDEWGSKKWLAHLNLGNDIFMSFLRGSKVDAETAARDWYERESNRFKHKDSCDMDGEGSVYVKEPLSDPVSGWGNAVGGWSSGPVGGKMTDGRAAAFTGKVWMLNRTTGERARIEAGLVAEYEGKGFIKAGPRSK